MAESHPARFKEPAVSHVEILPVKRQPPSDDVTQQAPRKRGPVNVSGACAPCRKGKRKCDGCKPICGACRKRVITPSQCVYDVLDGLSRSATMKHNLVSLKDERDTLRHLVKDLLKYIPGATMEDCIRRYERDFPFLAQAIGSDNEDTLDPALLPATDASHDQGGIRSLTSPTSLAWPKWTSDYPFPISESMDTSPTSIADSSVIPSPSNDNIFGRATGSMALNLASLHRNPETLFRGSHSAGGETSSGGSDAGNSARSQQLLTTRSFLESAAAQSKASGLFIHVHGHLPPSAHDDLAYGPGEPLPIGRFVNINIPLYLVTPMLLQDTGCPMGGTIVQFMQLARERIESGWHLDRILGPVRFDISRLLGGKREEEFTSDFDDFSIPSWAISLGLTFSELEVLPRLTMVLHFAKLMRWLLSPTAENYCLLHESQRPTPMQRLVPHFAEYSFALLPYQRDILITNPRYYLNTLQHFHSTWNRNTPYTMPDVHTNAVRVTSEFEVFATDMHNWTVDPAIFDIMPGLEGHCRIWRGQGSR